ncbi:MAG: tryptophan--tRNA ligase [Omnitrophica WOR_2 bacterium GWF2_38_59]|nr:MAG: tryptophan--tRNA ligase [Omnitrophica WOR_2 bacterium GWF2_38_59]OGX47754.1 MAG: tryptophan--tRNA ligase [Omnitrophica WOR_2 bacterium RIFOXYA2_FULL_38_17]OGX52622.1 MAG: tryptophan--tRNA ligase [Omnitrophica WOR_2 bacterium RIFOXYA12_FULL_38_10]OGX56005.1 MAG: tryptophan--tRNA ligase [Omnitrophica WOR_2 bacterium RIFOXYB2_FULL_38_16]OGX57717.1 MAG: tryptophan--tRNA ligase [Omnitrophica WOR_2 bacterium RIFOXYC2_FULL_38_12]HBG60364.1 tryptophan--tRNA ligase [Candidatus Omnitrophota bact
MKKTVFSGMRPTGKLHLGHLVGALKNWIVLQEDHACTFGIVDWHALMGEYEDSYSIKENIIDMAIDWIACGIDPERSIVYVQSHVHEHLELQMILSCITPLGWLERNPTYKEQLREIKTRDLQTYGFLGYPVLQAADILLYKANAVPIGEDQLPHLELTREISRRFNNIFKTDLFGDCEAILTETPRLLGTDGRKMSKSYNNAINLSDADDVILKKVKSMITDPKRIKLLDVGHPEECNVYSYYQVFASGQSQDVCKWCTTAQKGCTDCKKQLAEVLIEKLKPIKDKRAELEANKQKVIDILNEGKKKAQAIAQKTIREVKEAVFK